MSQKHPSFQTELDPKSLRSRLEHAFVLSELSKRHYMRSDIVLVVVLSWLLSRSKRTRKKRFALLPFALSLHSLI